MGRPAGSPNKLTAEVKEKLASVLDQAMDSIDVEKLTIAERLKLIQIGLTYVIPRLKHTVEKEEVPTNFQIEVVTSRSQLSEKFINDN